MDDRPIAELIREQYRRIEAGGQAMRAANVRRINPWPGHRCSSMACGKKEVRKHVEFAKKMGVPTEYRYCPETKDYEPVFTDQKHMEKLAKAKGYRVYC